MTLAKALTLTLERLQRFRCAYVVAVIAVYWIVEPIPLGATSLIPVVLFPMLGVLSTEKTCLLYMNEMIVTFLGTLIMAIAIEESCLHQRVALGALCLLGTGVKMLVFGLMAISMFLSMWINNVAITAMMMPVVDSLSHELLSCQKDDHAKEGGAELVSKSVTQSFRAPRHYLNSVPSVDAPTSHFQDSDGGEEFDSVTLLRTIIRCAPQLAVLNQTKKGKILTMNISKLVVFSRIPSIGLGFINRSLKTALATWPIKPIIKKLINTFCLISQQIATVTHPSNVRRAPQIHNEDGVYVAMTSFLKKNNYLKNKKKKKYCRLSLRSKKKVMAHCRRNPLIYRLPLGSTSQMPPVAVKCKRPKLDLQLLGYTRKEVALAARKLIIVHSAHTQFYFCMLQVSGLSHLMGQQLSSLGHLSPGLLMAALSIFCSFMTELISNAGTVTVLLPVFAALAEELKMNPLLFMIPATITSNFAFLLPVGTPANAIVYEHARLKVSDMASNSFLSRVLFVHSIARMRGRFVSLVPIGPTSSKRIFCLSQVLPGLFAKVITVMTTIAITYVLGDPVFGMFQYPDWIHGTRAINGTHL
ncbi:unnamed protein product [Ixodes hexagonus]